MVTCTVCSDGTQFDSEWIASFFVVLHTVFVTPCTIKIPPTAPYVSISEIQPKIARQFTITTLPSAWWYLNAVVKLL